MAFPILRPWKVYELKVRKKSYKSLRSQFSYLKKNLKELYEKPTLWVWIQTRELRHISDFFIDMWIYSLEDEIYWDIKASLISWYRGRSRINKDELDNFWIEFNKNNPSINAYMDEWSKLQLSDYKGSIAWTTKNSVIKILQEWFKQSKSYNEIAKDINKLDSTLFSMNRAKVIAINETWKAFEFGNALPIFEIVQKWWKAEKKRTNMKDSKVSEQCIIDAKDWRIDFRLQHTSWNHMPPWHINCRCHEQYRVLD